MAARPRRYVIRRPDQLEVLASPLRHQIVATMERLGECSVRELATHMGREPEALYYHVRKLVAVGLVRETGRQQSGPRSEALYSLIAGDIDVDPSGRSPRFLELVGRAASALLRLTERSYLAALGDPAGVRRGPRRTLSIRRHQVRLSDCALAELNCRLEALADFLAEQDDPDLDRFYGVTIALSPEVDRGSPELP